MEQFWNVHIWQEQIPGAQSLIYNQYINVILSMSKGIGSYSDFSHEQDKLLVWTVKKLPKKCQNWHWVKLKVHVLRIWTLTPKFRYFVLAFSWNKHPKLLKTPHNSSPCQHTRAAIFIHANSWNFMFHGIHLQTQNKVQNPFQTEHFCQ